MDYEGGQVEAGINYVVGTDQAHLFFRVGEDSTAHTDSCTFTSKQLSYSSHHLEVNFEKLITNF